MKKIKIRFSKELYENEALSNAVEIFKSFAKISVGEEDGFYYVSISSYGGDEEGGMLAGEIMNFVLAGTVELRAK